MEKVYREMVRRGEEVRHWKHEDALQKRKRTNLQKGDISRDEVLICVERITSITPIKW